MYSSRVSGARAFALLLQAGMPGVRQNRKRHAKAEGCARPPRPAAEQVGTRVYAVNLARALVKLPQVELTLLVEDPAQAKGMCGRVVTAAAWADDVDVIHKPAQVMDPAELRLLFESSAQLVITYQDLIAFRIPLVFASEARFETYRATSRLVLPAVQRIIAYSESVSREITAEFGIPQDEITVVMLAAERRSHGRKLGSARRSLRLPRRYFFSLASDYPHKNLVSLLDAYRKFRTRWHQGDPPSLVLAGYSSGARSGLYPQLESTAAPRAWSFWARSRAISFRFFTEKPRLSSLRLFTKDSDCLRWKRWPPERRSSRCRFRPCRRLPAMVCFIAMASRARPLPSHDESRIRSENFALSFAKRASSESRNFAGRRRRKRRTTFTVQPLRHLRSDRFACVVHCVRSSSIGRRRAAVTGDLAGLAMLGIRDAYRALETAVRTRVRRQLRRLRPFPAGRVD